MAPSRYKCSVLVVDDEPAVLALLTGQLRDEFEVFTAPTAEAARSTLSGRAIDIVLTDLQLPDANGIQLLDWVQHNAPRTARVLLSGTARIEDAADAINCSRVHRLVLKPWRAEDLLTNLRQVARGLLLERSHEELLEELRQLNLELEQRVGERTRELEHALQQLQVKNQILEKMALTDALTGLPNRRAIELIARKELLRRTRTPAPIAFGLVDADRFKQINSDYHLSGGDHVLTWLGHTLQSAIRGTDALGRVGGEEFMVVAPATDIEGVSVLAERLRVMVESDGTRYREWDIKLTVSVGFAVVAAGIPIGYDALREAAAAALSDAKTTGRNRSVVRHIG
jgi:diguanylate cyclase (GGDEF)-like protein